VPTHRLIATPLGPTERRALEIIQASPGRTVAELGEALGVGKTRVHQIVKRLRRPMITREASHYTAVGKDR
jgi:DNA-binding MarR family transcriptional regulator